jgi:phenylacetate-coenzyme A ligase PaaK-like adenylate-forming protein
VTARLSVGEFLEQNRGFVFNLPEYIESTRFTERARKRFNDFRKSFLAPRSTTSPWEIKRTAIESVVRYIPAYDSIDWQRSDYWESIPLINKDSVRARPDDFLSPGYDRKRLWLRETSGTSGLPLQIWYAPEFFCEIQFFSACKIAWLAGAFTDEVSRTPVFCVALGDNKLLSKRVWASPDGSPGLTLRLIFDERRRSSVERLAALFDRHHPAILTLKPNILGSIVRRLSEPCRAATDYLRLIISGGANLDEELRQNGQRLLGVQICNEYGLSEVGVVASECTVQDGLHVYEEDVIPEILHDDGNLQEAGTGELVVSSVANPAMPLLRYRTGDTVELTSEPCKCGKKGRRIRSISGKLLHNYRLSDGSEFSPTSFHDLFKLFPIREFRLTQTHVDRIQAEIEFLPTCMNPTEQLVSVQRHIERELRFLVRVDASEVVFSPGSKFQGNDPAFR